MWQACPSASHSSAWSCRCCFRRGRSSSGAPAPSRGASSAPPAACAASRARWKGCARRWYARSRRWRRSRKTSRRRAPRRRAPPAPSASCSRLRTRCASSSRRRACTRSRREASWVTSSASCGLPKLIAESPAMQPVLRLMERVGPSEANVLILGEHGTGKEVVARWLHASSLRAERPMVAVNLGGIPDGLFESELFGHVKGSFTGAVGERKGYFEQADRGTIFLDEIGELRPPHQSKLLRVLQEKSFYRVGATRSTAVDVRVVAASNRDLERGITAGWFREDLYFRLKGLVLRLPPLRERRQDVAPLAARFLEEAAAEAGRRVGLSEAALLALEGHDWPGNVRELSNCLRQAVALSERAVLGPEDLRLSPAGDPRAADATGDGSVLDSLRAHGFDMQATARALGWDRSTVTQRLKGLGFRALVEADGDRRKAALALADDPALGRAVELKLSEYHEHLLRAVEGFDSADAAVAACRRRFKNLPERHFRSLEFLVRQHFERRPPPSGT
ncbi:MAG: hypothetical protein DME15_15330 [Candidatus Rokuibacteriota bacterium]|nr:MAG: hypothetical protein DME15_15330 [Candidatus Rokubacteria bacterium]